ncbi:AMP-binding protein [Candidatus Rickettsiella viridis]|uniref:AMP-binding protein n=1 Tax=Candidatus Rickettsiella viridis TaxID=676208 RepID=UPI000F84B780|nr:AMP-binding protein [Candidatus Rickettsiella viridis]
MHDISCVSKKEQAELLSFSKGPVHHYHEDLVSVFEQQVFNYPDSIAISHTEMRLTYRELDQLSTGLANHLAKEGVGATEPVGLYFEKAYLFFIAELALLKLGAVFVPLSKADPVERLNFIIQDAKINHVVSDLNFSIKPESQVQFIKISKQALEEMAVQEEARLLVPASLDSRVCILYTSGSTGVPKGVTLKQKGIIRVVKSANYIQVDHQDKVAQAANLAFDAAQLECWLAWANGAALVIIDKDVLLDYKLFDEKLLAENVTILWLTAALFHQYAYTKPTVFSNLKYLLAGGDAVEKKAMQEVFSCSNNNALNLIIGYGPTEASIFATTCRVTADIFNDFSSIPIGRPVNNTEIRLLDRFKKLAPLGAKAHLAIGGDSLTEGYLRNPKLQKERFVICPELLPSTLYLSGDQVRLTRIDNPQLLFCGRMDGEQLKRVGVLVSLPEIEAALMSHPAVKQAALLTKELGSGKKQLIAFYIRHKDTPILDNKIFSDYLSSKLPPFMFPDFYQELNRFPTTANGKLDKKALLSYKLDFATRNSPVVLTDSQRKIANLFRDVLSLPPMAEYEIGLDDSFFNCGGTSILTVQLIYEIEQLFGVRLSFNLLRQNSSIRAIDQILNLPVACSNLEQNSSLILFQQGEKTLAPVGFIHPAGGALYCYEELMKKTRLNNTFFGIEDPVLSHGIRQNLSLEEMAKSYLLQIEDKIKQPFILSGYSFGGMLALEMAAQLEERKVNNLIGVILLDTWVVSCASESIKCQLKQEVLNYYSQVRDKIGETRKHLMDQLEQRYRYLQDLGFAFKPKKLENTRVILLKATLLGSAFEHMAGESKNNYLLDFVDDNKFHRAPIQGTHYSILEEEYVDSTAKVFSEQVMKLQKNEFDTVNTDRKELLDFFVSEKNIVNDVINSTNTDRKGPLGFFALEKSGVNGIINSTVSHTCTL